MLKKVGVYLNPAGTTTSAPVGRAYFWRIDTPNISTAATVHRVAEGDILRRVASAVYSQSTVGSVQLALYKASSTQPTEFIKSYTINIPAGSPIETYRILDIDEPLDDYIGEELTVVNGLQSSARFHIVPAAVGPRYYSSSFPPAGGTGTAGATTPLYYMEIESPAPDGFTDIVVGEDPLYGDDRSIVKDFTGDVPAPGDQLRHANMTTNGADVVVRPNLTYTGDYGENPVPETDTLEVAYWSGTEWQWYTVTVVFSDTPPEEAPVNTVLPEITGVTTVRQELTATNGTWTGSPTGFTYRWFVDGVDTGITTNTFTPVDDSYQKLVTVEVTATNEFGSTAAMSEAVGPLGGFAPIIQPFTIQGVPRVGSVLRFNLTVDAVPSAIVTTNWEDATTGEILAVNTNTYRLRSEDLGDMIKVDVVAENEEGQTYYESVSVGPVEDAAPVEDSDFIYLDWIALNYPKGDADA